MDELVPAALIKLPKVGDSAILVEKKSQTLKVYTFSSPGPMPTDSYEKVFEADCSTGEAAGRKLVEGDKKTPEGIYFIKKIFEDRYLTPIYGKRAFTTDYPNMLDQKLGRTGSAIWIHGTNRPLVPMDSNGCVAMRNRDVVVLDRYIQPDHTPIVLANTLQYCTVHEMAAQREVLLNFISQWCEAMNHGDFGTILKFYGDDLPPDGVTWKKWQHLRQWNRTRSEGEGEEEQRAVSITLSAQNVGIYQQVNQLIVLFDLVLTRHDHQLAKQRLTVGKRKWFLDNGHVRLPRAAVSDTTVSDTAVSGTTASGTAVNGTTVSDTTASEETHPLAHESFYGNGSTYQIAADGYSVLSISVRRGEDPLISGANKLYRAD